MSICVRFTRTSATLLSLFLLFQTQSLLAQESGAPRNTAKTAIAADAQAAGDSVTAASQVVPALPVPRLVKYSGVAKDATGQPHTGVAGMTFSIYASQEGGAPLWMETQNVELDAHGHYATLLGSTQSAGMPLNLFATGDQRWLGVKLELPGEVEQPRVLLVSVPYALKASDADTVGGMPASAFVMAPTGSGSGAAANASATAGAKSKENKSGTQPQSCSGCSQNWVPLFTDSAGDATNSVISQTNGKVAVGQAVAGSQNALLIVGNGGGGNMFNGSNSVDTDFFVTLSAPHASPPVSTFGPSVPSNLALQVGSVPYLWINSAGNVGIDTTAPVNTLDVEADGIYSNSNVYGVESYGAYEGGYFNGSYFGTTSVTSYDGAFYVGAYGYEFGATQETIGVSGYSASGVGVGTYGQAINSSAEGAIFGGVGAFGVWGDTNTNGSFGSGVFASGDNNYALLAVNNSTTWDTAWFENDENTASGQVLLHTDGYNGSCNIDVSGNLFCSGSKSAVVPVDGGSRKVALYAIEGPENWFEDAGGGQLQNGEAVVNLESVFGQTVNTDVDYRVFLTPNGDCKGLYVAQKSATGFVVRELGGGTSNIAFDYRIMAKRKGFEQVRLADKSEFFSEKGRPVRRTGAAAKKMPTAQEMQKRMAKRLHGPKTRKVARLSEGPLNKKQ